MNKIKHKNKLIIIILLECTITWICSSIPAITEKITYYRNYLFIMGVLGILFICIVMKDRAKDLRIETLILIVFAIGLAIRGLYVITAPYNISKHDLGTFMMTSDSEIESGHLGYIGYLFHLKHLPDFDPRGVWAFYNPPGFHILGAIWYGFNRWIGLSQTTSLENLQILTLGLSAGIIYLVYQIVTEFFRKNKVMLLTVAFLSFFPFFTIMGAMLNNDCLAMFCSMLAILYTIRWYRKPTLKNILVIALSISYGMFTKLSVGLLAFAIGFVFLYHFITRKEKRINFFKQFILFGCICFPLGLFWPVRNAIRYHVPFNYVPKVGGNQYIGFHNLWSRLGIPGFHQIDYSFIQFDTHKESNVWVQLVRTGLFDEIMPPNDTDLIHPIALALLWIALLLGLITILLAIKTFLSTKKKRVLPIFFTLLFATLVISYVKFCLEYPAICTMNFRYIATIVLLPSLIWTGYLNGTGRIAWSKKVLNALIICFIFMSIIINGAFILWGPRRY